MNFISILEENIQLFSKSIAIIDSATGQMITYQNLWDQVEAVTCGLVATGIEAGDRVALYLPNGMEFIVAYLAVLKAGAIAVPFNIQLKSQEIKRILKGSCAKAVIGREKELGEELIPIRHEFPNLHTVVGVGQNQGVRTGLRFSDWLLNRGQATAVRLEDDQPAAIHYTSGTTGRMKGALLTHKNIAVNAKINGHYLLGLNDQDRVLGLSPYCHVYFFQVVLGPLSVGAAVVTLPRSSPRLALAAVEKYGITHVSTVPTMYGYLLKQFREGHYDVSSWRVAGSAATNISPEMAQTIQAVFQVDFFDTYGCTETSSTVTYTRLRHYKPGSVGLPAHGYSLKIVDDREGEVGGDQVGEVVVKGPGVFSGYWEMPEETKRFFTADGWYKTGDLGRQDQEGYVYIVGRKGDVIISGGYNIYPWEIEEVLLRHPAIADAAVVGRPDQDLGEIPVGYIILKQDADLSPEEMIAFCQKRLARYKCPREIKFVANFPRAASGKVLKRLLAEGHHPVLCG